MLLGKLDAAGGPLNSRVYRGDNRSVRLLVALASANIRAQAGDVDRAPQALRVFSPAVVVDSQPEIERQLGADLEIVAHICAPAIGAGEREGEAFRRLRGKGTTQQKTGEGVPAGLAVE